MVGLPSMKTTSLLSSGSKLPQTWNSLKLMITSLLQSMLAYAIRIWNSPGVKLGVTVFLVSRLALGLWLIIVRILYSDPLLPDPILRPYLGIEISANPIIEPWQRWDTLHYQAIAERGYLAFGSALFVPPLYPFLIRITSMGTAGDTLFAGIIISNLAYLLGLIAFYRYAFEENPDINSSKRSLIYLASFPAAFFFLAAYTESLFLLFASLALLSALRRNWLFAGISGGLAALTRLPGALIIIPLGYAAYIEWRENGNFKPWIAPILTGLGAIFFPLYSWLELGQMPWSPFLVQSARFNGGFTFPGLNIIHAAQRIFLGQAFVADVLDLFLILFFIVCAIPVWTTLSRISSIYYLSFLILYLIREAGVQPLLGTARYVLVFIPAFIVLGMIGKSKKMHRLILYSSWLLLLFMAGQFAIWGWIG